MAKKQKTIIAYKAFDKDLKCRDFQYKVGETYEHDGDVKACNSGFHSCELPLDVLNYYPLDSRFARVEASGSISKHGDDSKIASAKITISAEIALPEMITETVNFIISQCKKAKKNIASGRGKAAASSGNSSTAASSGNSSKAASSGNSSTAASSGNSSTAASSGYYSKAECDTNGFACVAGVDGAVKGNAGSALSLGYKDSNGKNRIMVAYVGEDGIKENTWYRVKDGRIVEV